MRKALSGSSRALLPEAGALKQPNFNCRTFPARSHGRGHARRLLLAPAQDAPDTGGGPTLAGLGWLLQAIHDAVLDHLHDRLVYPQAAVHLGAEELGEAAHFGASAKDALFQLIGGLLEPMAPQAVGDHAGVHRPARSVVIRAGAEPRGRGRLGANAWPGTQDGREQAGDQTLAERCGIRAVQ